MPGRKIELRQGRAYALDASLLDELFGFECAPVNVVTPGCEATVVEISGPLEQRTGWGWDSYEAIGARIDAALGDTTPAVILRFSSPGGDAAGCVELARSIRASADRARKPIYAYVDDRACSAAYVLAAACDSITLAPSAIVGSVGVIATRVDVTARNAVEGIKVALVVSGARKSDGHPDFPITDAELEAQQELIDSFAALLFGLVDERRRVDSKALEAAVFHGQDAVDKRLADSVEGFDAFVATTVKGTVTMDPKEAARKALEEMATGEGEDAKRAKRALAALDAADEEKPDEKKKEGEPDGDEAEDEKEKPAAKAKSKAEDDEEKPTAEDDEEKPAAMARRALKVARSAKDAADRLRADLTTARESAERERLLATRSDLNAETLKSLRNPITPLATVRELVKSIPRAPSGAGAREALAAGGAAPTVGSTQGELDGPRLPPDQKQQMDELMGLSTPKIGIVNTPTRLTLGARLPK